MLTELGVVPDLSNYLLILYYPQSHEPDTTE